MISFRAKLFFSKSSFIAFFSFRMERTDIVGDLGLDLLDRCHLMLSSVLFRVGIWERMPIS